VTLYSAADVFVFPSWYEGFGLPVLEAMACGTPAIASSRGALPEVAGEPGIIVDAEDHDTIARAIVDLFDGEQAAGLRERSLAWARRFTWERTALQMRQVYADVAPAPRAVETQPMRDAQPT
jgi:glycosyltransferase involved in cell wall biosynthesis